MFRVAAILVLCLSLPAICQDPPPPPPVPPPLALVVSGDGIKVITVAQDFPSKPITISGPVKDGKTSALAFVWDVPPGVVYSNKDDTIVITSAPPGQLDIGSRVSFVDFVAQTVIKKSFTTTVFIAGAPAPPPPPPPPPGPPPGPAPVVDPALLVKLQAAYAAETDPLKASRAAKFAKMLAGIVEPLRATGIVTTNTQFYDVIHNNCEVDPEIGPIAKGSIPLLRTAVGAYVAGILPQKKGLPVDNAFWDKAQASLGTAAATIDAMLLSARR